MPTFKVHMTRVCSEILDVTVPEGADQDETIEAAIEAAFNVGAGDLCIRCMGLTPGSHVHRELSGARELEAVEDAETGALLREVLDRWDRVPVSPTPPTTGA